MVCEQLCAHLCACAGPCVCAHAYARAWLRFGATGRLSRAFAAGRTFSSRTLKAGWAARAYHTSVIDAAVAIYVLGGYVGSPSVYNDVWVSTDGGARPDSVKGGRGVHQGYSR